MNGRKHQIFIIASVFLPPLGVAVAVVLLWNRVVGWSDVAAFLIMYAIAGLGVSTGYHRLFTHRAFKTSRPMRIFFASAGAVAGQGPPLIWTAHHRRHHRLADKPGDPHSPYVDMEPGIRGALKGLWHAHMGWLFNEDLTSDPMRYCPDLARDRDIRIISRFFVSFVIAGLILPGFIGWAISGTFFGFLTGMLWGGLVRFFLGNHATYAVNSLGHFFGSRRFETADESRNNFWLAIPSFGEAWHNNHHAFPRSYRHGMVWYEIDISQMVIVVLEKLHLVWDVVRIDPQAIERRAQVLTTRGGGRFAVHEPTQPLANRSHDHQRDLATVGIQDVE